MRLGPRALAAAGYVGLFLVAFYVALVLAFPVDMLKRSLVAAVERDSPLTLLISDLSLGWGGGLHARGVAVAWPAGARPIPVLIADRVDVDLALLPMLRGRVEARFDGRAYGGRFDGRIEAPLGGGPADRLVLRLERLDLSRHAGLAQATRVVVAGLLSGELDLALAPAGVALVPAGEAPASGTGAGAGASGTVRLLLERGSLRELPLIGGSLPEVGIDRATASARVVPDRLDVEALEARGPQASLAASARVGLRRPVEASTLEGTVRLRPERALPPALRQMLTAFSRPPDASGAFAYGLRGTLGAPSLRPL